MPWSVALAFVVALILASSEARAQQVHPGPSVPVAVPALTASSRSSMLGWSDVCYGVAAGAGVAIAYQADLRTRHEAIEADRPNLDGLAHFAEKFGNPIVLGPVLVVVDQTAGLRRLPGLRGATRRVGGALLVAGLADEVLKRSVGRARPMESGGSPHEFKPFSSFDSFPSGHTTLAFAAAAALDRETSARWVPWVAYPLAGLVGWSRIHDDRHWTSDVVAGAALGAWVGDKVSRLEARSGPDPRGWFGAADPFMVPGPRGLILGVHAAF